MRLARLKLKNFRCYGEDEIVIDMNDFTAFIGTNSSGKTAALEALAILFSPVSAKRGISFSDFHLGVNEKMGDKDKRELSIEAVFEFDELKEEGAGKKSIPPYFESVVVESAESIPVMRIRLMATWSKSAQVNGTVETRYFYVQCAETDEESELDLFQASRSELSMIRVVYVPAVRNLSEQLKSMGGSLMNQFVGNINWSQTVREEIDSQFDSINESFHKELGVKTLAEAIKKEWRLFSNGAKFSNAELCFNSGNLSQAVKTSSVVFSPGIEPGKCEVDSIGDGLRSLFYLSFASVFVEMQEKINSGDADANNAFDIAVPVLTILAVEEPENHVSPHLLGRVAANLIAISSRRGAQVAISSHSASIVKRVEPDHIRHFRYDNTKQSTVVTSIPLPDSSIEAGKYVRCAVRAYPELYFSRFVVLCEGDSEELVLPRIVSAISGTLDEHEISIVPLGGRHVNHFWRLLESIKVPYVTLLDLDYGRDGGGLGRIKGVLEQMYKHKAKNFSEILDVDGEKLTVDRLSDFEKRADTLVYWLKVLELQHIYFSTPLDLDYAMLSRFKDVYTNLGEESLGPFYLYEDYQNGGRRRRVYITEEEKCGRTIPDEIVQERKQHVLKKSGNVGVYVGRQHASRMVWYDYLFLGKGKPATHIKAMSLVGEDELKKRAPSCLLRLARDVLGQLA